MSLIDFRRLVPYFNDVETIVLQGWGEPLLHKDLIPLIRAAKGERRDDVVHPRTIGSRPPAVGFVTSGKGLDAQYSAELIDAGLDFIGFSFAGSSAATHESIRVNSDFSELVAAIRAFNDLKDRKGKSTPRSHIVFLMLRDNLHDILDLPRLARDIGIREVVLTNLIHVTTPWQDAQRVFSCDDRADFSDILRAAEESAREIGVHLRLPSLRANEMLLCEENPLKNLYISVTGDVSPCVYLHPPTIPQFKRIFCGREHQAEQVRFGNIFQEPFSSLWENAGYSDFRKQIACRVQQHEGMYSPFSSFENKEGRSEVSQLPEPPIPCRTCHKMLGL